MKRKLCIWISSTVLDLSAAGTLFFETTGFQCATAWWLELDQSLRWSQRTAEVSQQVWRGVTLKTGPPVTFDQLHGTESLLTNRCGSRDPNDEVSHIVSGQAWQSWSLDSGQQAFCRTQRFWCSLNLRTTQWSGPDNPLYTLSDSCSTTPILFWVWYIWISFVKMYFHNTILSVLMTHQLVPSIISKNNLLANWAVGANIHVGASCGC